jgi:hypothetical protein
MTAVARLTVVYGRDADVYDAATAADSALEGHGVRVMIERNELGGFGVWLVKRDDPTEQGRWFLPGKQLVVSYDDGWRIEDVAGPEVAA